MPVVERIYEVATHCTASLATQETSPGSFCARSETNFLSELVHHVQETVKKQEALKKTTFLRAARPKKVPIAPRSVRARKLEKLEA